MKYRTSFVSNSSSTSFCIIGISTYDAPYKSLLKQLKPTGVKYEDWYGGHGWFPLNDKHLYGYGNGDEYPDYIGFDIKELENKNLKQVRKKFVAYIKMAYNVDIDERQVNLFYGEVGN
jgi:hypothetical protein